MDIHFRIFRFSNYWYYFLTGERTNFSEFRTNTWSYTDYINIDALVKVDDDSVLYKGVVKELIPDDSGRLDKIVLGKTRIRNFEKHGEKFEVIAGHEFVIPYDKVINLNVNYRSFQRTKPKEMDEALTMLIKDILKRRKMLLLLYLTIPVPKQGDLSFYKSLWYRAKCKFLNFLFITIPNTDDFIEIANHLKRLFKKSISFIQIAFFSLINLFVLHIGFKITKASMFYEFINSLLYFAIVLFGSILIFQIIRYFNIEYLRKHYILGIRDKVPEIDLFMI